MSTAPVHKNTTAAKEEEKKKEEEEDAICQTPSISQHTTEARAEEKEMIVKKEKLDDNHHPHAIGDAPNEEEGEDVHLTEEEQTKIRLAKRRAQMAEHNSVLRSTNLPHLLIEEIDKETEPFQQDLLSLESNLAPILKVLSSKFTASADIVLPGTSMERFRAVRGTFDQAVSDVTDFVEKADNSDMEEEGDEGNNGKGTQEGRDTKKEGENNYYDALQKRFLVNVLDIVRSHLAKFFEQFSPKRKERGEAGAASDEKKKKGHRRRRKKKGKKKNKKEGDAEKEDHEEREEEDESGSATNTSDSSTGDSSYDSEEERQDKEAVARYLADVRREKLQGGHGLLIDDEESPPAEFTLEYFEKKAERKHKETAAITEPLKNVIREKTSTIEKLAKKCTKAYQKIDNLRGSLTDMKESVQGLNPAQLCEVIERNKVLENENEYLHQRAVVIDATEKRESTQRFVMGSHVVGVLEGGGGGGGGSNVGGLQKSSAGIPLQTASSSSSPSTSTSKLHHGHRGNPMVSQAQANVAVAILPRVQHRCRALTEMIRRLEVSHMAAEDADDGNDDIKIKFQQHAKKIRELREALDAARAPKLRREIITEYKRTVHDDELLGLQPINTMMETPFPDPRKGPTPLQEIKYFEEEFFSILSQTKEHRMNTIAQEVQMTLTEINEPMFDEFRKIIGVFEENAKFMMKLLSKLGGGGASSCSPALVTAMKETCMQNIEGGLRLLQTSRDGLLHSIHHVILGSKGNIAMMKRAVEQFLRLRARNKRLKKKKEQGGGGGVAPAVANVDEDDEAKKGLNDDDDDDDDGATEERQRLEQEKLTSEAFFKQLQQEDKEREKLQKQLLAERKKRKEMKEKLKEKRMKEAKVLHDANEELDEEGSEASLEELVATGEEGQSENLELKSKQKEERIRKRQEEKERRKAIRQAANKEENEGDISSTTSTSSMSEQNDDGMTLREMGKEEVVVEDDDDEDSELDKLYSNMIENAFQHVDHSPPPPVASSTLVEKEESPPFEGKKQAPLLPKKGNVKSTTTTVAGKESNNKTFDGQQLVDKVNKIRGAYVMNENSSSSRVKTPQSGATNLHALKGPGEKSTKKQQASQSAVPLQPWGPSGQPQQAGGKVIPNMQQQQGRKGGHMHHTPSTTPLDLTEDAVDPAACEHCGEILKCACCGEIVGSYVKAHGVQDIVHAAIRTGEAKEALRAHQQHHHHKVVSNPYHFKKPEEKSVDPKDLPSFQFEKTKSQQVVFKDIPSKPTTKFDTRHLDSFFERSARIKEKWAKKRKVLEAQNKEVAKVLYQRLVFALYRSSHLLKVKLPSLKQLIQHAKQKNQLSDEDDPDEEDGSDEGASDRSDRSASSCSSQAESTVSYERIEESDGQGRRHMGRNRGHRRTNRSPNNLQSKTNLRKGRGGEDEIFDVEKKLHSSSPTPVLTASEVENIRNERNEKLVIPASDQFTIPNFFQQQNRPTVSVTNMKEKRKQRLILHPSPSLQHTSLMQKANSTDSGGLISSGEQNNTTTLGPVTYGLQSRLRTPDPSSSTFGSTGGFFSRPQTQQAPIRYKQPHIQHPTVAEQKLFDQEQGGEGEMTLPLRPTQYPGQDTHYKMLDLYARQKLVEEQTILDNIMANQRRTKEKKERERKLNIRVMPTTMTMQQQQPEGGNEDLTVGTRPETRNVQSRLNAPPMDGGGPKKDKPQKHGIGTRKQLNAALDLALELDRNAMFDYKEQ